MIPSPAPISARGLAKRSAQAAHPYWIDFDAGKGPEIVALQILQDHPKTVYSRIIES